MEGVVRLSLSPRCNWDCSFCSRHEQEGAFERLDAYVQSLEEARMENSALVITGGEPSLYPELRTLIQKAADFGYDEITLETNGSGIQHEHDGKALADAGLTTVEVLILAARGDLAHALSGEPDAAATSLRALEASVGVVPATVARIPLTRFNLLEVAATLSAIAAKAPGVEGVVFDWLPAKSLKDPARSWLPPRLLRSSYPHFVELASQHGFAVTLRGEDGVAACLAPEGEHVADLADRYRRVAKAHDEPSRPYLHVRACQQCPQREFCPGISPYERGMLTAKDIRVPETAKIRQVVLHDAEEERRRRMERPDMSLMTYGSEGAKGAVIRINYRCQMTCSFCWVDLHGGEKEWERVQQEINLATGQGCIAVSFSGGEPTLSKNLVPAIAYCRDQGYEMINIESNAMLLKRPERADEIVAAGLTDAFISLHAVDPDVSDEITGVPDGHPQTIAGIRNLLERGVEVVLNYVITRANIDQLERFPRFVAETFAGYGDALPGIRYSAAHVINNRVSPDSVPQYTHLARPLHRSLESALEWGVPLKEVGGQCGVPPCVLGGDPRFFPLEHRHSHSQSVDENFRKVAACETCVFQHACVGVRQGYLDLYGDSEFRPVLDVPDQKSPSTAS